MQEIKDAYIKRSTARKITNYSTYCLTILLQRIELLIKKDRLKTNGESLSNL